MKKQYKILLYALGAAAVAGGGYFAYSKLTANTASDILPNTKPLPYQPILPISLALPVSNASGKAGASAYPKNDSLNVRKDASQSSSILFNVTKGIKAGIATGKTRSVYDGIWHEITTAKGAGWVRSDVVSLSYV